MASKKQRITTCSDYVAKHPSGKFQTSSEDGKALKALRAKGCQRLPNHRGDCRGTLNQPRDAAQAKTTKSSAVDPATLIAAIEDGSMTPSEALSLLAASKKRSPRRTTKSSTATTKSKTASSSKTTKSSADLPVVWGCNVRTKSGQIGKVTKVTDERVTIRTKSGETKTFVLSSVTRIAPKAAAAA